MYEETASHSGIEETTEVMETVETPIESEAPPQEELKGISVKYNKEERFVPEDEVPTWVQKGLNYDKVSEKAQQAERYQQTLERTAKLYGFDDLESYQAALDQAEQDRRIQEEAQKLGMDEDLFRAHMAPVNERLSKAEQELQQYRAAESIRAVEAQIASLSAQYPDFAQHQESIIEMSIKKGYDLEDAYILTTYQDRVNNAVTEAKRETLKNIQQNADSSTGYLGADAPDQASGYSAMSATERKAMREANRRRA